MHIDDPFTPLFPRQSPEATAKMQGIVEKLKELAENSNIRIKLLGHDNPGYRDIPFEPRLLPATDIIDNQCRVMYGKGRSEVTDAQLSLAKNAVHGMVYGSTGLGMMTRIEKKPKYVFVKARQGSKTGPEVSIRFPSATYDKIVEFGGGHPTDIIINQTDAKDETTHTPGS